MPAKRKAASPKDSCAATNGFVSSNHAGEGDIRRALIGHGAKTTSHLD